MKISEDVKKIIEENPVALASVNEDSTPNVIAVAYVKVQGDKIVITDNYMAQTKKNVLARPAVCLAVWDKDWNGYKLIGEVEYHDSGEWLEFVKSMKENKGCPAKGALVVKVKEIKKLA